VGLAWTCAENKGCYTGQEIIARQITYDKVTRTLVGLETDAPVTAGARVTAEGKNVGAVTSAAYSPSRQTHMALAVVRRPHNEPGQQVTVVASDRSEQGEAEATIKAHVLSMERMQVEE
jgi:glycine cleavage system aminomethyltransferase T